MIHNIDFCSDFYLCTQTGNPVYKQIFLVFGSRVFS